MSLTIPRRGSLAAAGATAGFSATVLATTGLAHYFALDEAAGPPLDSKGSATGVAGAGVTFGGTALAGGATEKAITCNGTNAMVTLSSLTVTVAPVTFLIYFNSAGAPHIGDTTYQCLFASGASNRFLVKSDGTGFLDQLQGVSNAITATVSGTHSVFVTIDAIATTSVYLDGVQVGSIVTSSTAVPKASMFVGCYEAVPTNYPWNGRLQAFAEWNQVISAADMAKIVAAQ